MSTSPPKAYPIPVRAIDLAHARLVANVRGPRIFKDSRRAQGRTLAHVIEDVRVGTIGELALSRMFGQAAEVSCLSKLGDLESKHDGGDDFVVPMSDGVAQRIDSKCGKSRGIRGDDAIASAKFSLNPRCTVKPENVYVQSLLSYNELEVEVIGWAWAHQILTAAVTGKYLNWNKLSDIRGLFRRAGVDFTHPLSR